MTMAQIRSLFTLNTVFTYRARHLCKRSANYPGEPVSETPLCCANVLSEIASPSITFAMSKDNLGGVDWWKWDTGSRMAVVEGGDVARSHVAGPTITSLSSTCPLPD